LADPKRVDLRVKQKRAILVGVVLPGAQRDLEEPLDELRGLAKTAGVKEVGSLVQNRQWPDATTYLGKGKVAELKQLIELQKADTHTVTKLTKPQTHPTTTHKPDNIESQSPYD